MQPLTATHSLRDALATNHSRSRALGRKCGIAIKDPCRVSYMERDDALRGCQIFSHLGIVDGHLAYAVPTRATREIDQAH